VHCSRLKAVNELDNDYRVERATADRPLYEGITPSGGTTIHVRVGDPLPSQANALVVYVDGQLQPVSEDGARIIAAAGARVTEERLNHVRLQRQDTVLITGAGDLPHVDKIIHSIHVGTDNLQQRLLEVLRAAIENDAIKTITVPFPGLDVEESQAWALAGQAARAINEIDGKLNNVNKVELERVTFICTSLLFADVLCTVLRQHLQVKQEIEPPALPLATGKVKMEPQRDSNSPQPNQGQAISDQTNDGWCTIERILR